MTLQITDWRGLVGLGCLLLISVSGCKKPSDPTPSRDTPTPVASNTSAAVPPPPPPTARAAADAFLVALADAKPTADFLHPDFKRRLAVAKPAELLLARYAEAGSKFEIKSEATLGSATLFTGESTGATKKRFALIVGAVNAANKRPILWFHAVTNPLFAELTANTEETRPIKVALAAFLEPLLAGDRETAEAALAKEAKAEHAPPLKDEHQVVGYNSESLRGNYFGRFIDKFTEADIGSITTQGDTAVIPVTLKKPNAPTTYILKAGKDSATGLWIITAIDEK